MPDSIIEDRLELIREHINVISERMKKIANAQDFVATSEGQILYDSLLVRLQSIGENFKKLRAFRMDLPNFSFTWIPARSFGFAI